MVARNDYDKILETVSAWPLEDRTSLINDLVRGLSDFKRPAPPRNTLPQARGLLRTDKPAPTDEEVRQWLEEHRMNKYGKR